MNIYNICRNIVRLQDYAGITDEIMAGFFEISTGKYSCLRHDTPVISITDLHRVSGLFLLFPDELCQDEAPARFPRGCMRGLSAEELRRMAKGNNMHARAGKDTEIGQ